MSAITTVFDDRLYYEPPKSSPTTASSWRQANLPYDCQRVPTFQSEAVISQEIIKQYLDWHQLISLVKSSFEMSTSPDADVKVNENSQAGTDDEEAFVDVESEEVETQDDENFPLEAIAN